MRELLAFVEDLLTRHGIFHFLDYGSLLGAVRSCTLIEWDEDADFSCLGADLSRVLDLKAEIESAGFWLDIAQIPHVVRVCRSRLNLTHADIWFQRVENNYSYTWNVMHENLYRFPVHYLNNLGSVLLEGKLHPAPMPVERFLAEHRYGPDFLTPRRAPADLSWISKEALSDEVQEALEQLQDVEYRLGCAKAKGDERIDGLAPRILGSIPGPVMRLHRSIWRVKERLAGRRDPVLLEVRHQLHRRRTLLKLLESRANPT